MAVAIPRARAEQPEGLTVIYDLGHGFAAADVPEWKVIYTRKESPICKVSVFDSCQMEVKWGESNCIVQSASPFAKRHEDPLWEVVFNFMLLSKLDWHLAKYFVADALSDAGFEASAMRLVGRNIK